MKITLRYLSVAALLLAACSKFTGPTQVSGLVVDEHTNQPVANATVQAVSSSTSWSGGGSAAGPSTQTDAQGRFSFSFSFSFSFEANGDKLYQLQAYSASGYTLLSTPFVDGGRKTDNMVVKVKAPAWVRINCIDDPPYGRAGLNTSGYSGSGDYQGVGPGDYSFVRPTLSYFSNVILWRTVDGISAQVKEGKESYNTIAFDTATVTIHF